MSWPNRIDLADDIEGAGIPGSGAPRGPVRIPFKPITLSADGTIDPRSGFVVLSKGSAAAMTLAAPQYDGQHVVITTGTAFAHVVTATSLIQDGVTGGAKSAWTAAAFVGSSLELRGVNGFWNVVSKNLGAIA